LKRARAEQAEAAPPSLAHLAVVLVEPAEPGNVGAVARLLWNLGGGELRLVVADPDRRATIVGPEARARACHGLPLLEGATFHDDLRGALAGIGHAFAFTARTGRFRQPRRELDEAARRAARSRDVRVAFVFGREDRGLLAEEAALAHELVRIPAPGADPVMNLSHAVALALWEVVRAAAAFAATRNWRKPPRLASVEERAALRSQAAALLVELGLEPGVFSDLQGRILRRFVDLFDRGGGEYADFSMLQGLFVAIRRRFDLLGGPKEDVASGAAAGLSAGRASARAARSGGSTRPRPPRTT
jgi:tRNA/rRNA methyltransferase